VRPTNGLKVLVLTTEDEEIVPTEIKTTAAPTTKTETGIFKKVHILAFNDIIL